MRSEHGAGFSPVRRDNGRKQIRLRQGEGCRVCLEVLDATAIAPSRGRSGPTSRTHPVLDGSLPSEEACQGRLMGADDLRADDSPEVLPVSPVHRSGHPISLPSPRTSPTHRRTVVESSIVTSRNRPRGLTTCQPSLAMARKSAEISRRLATTSAAYPFVAPGGDPMDPAAALRHRGRPDGLPLRAAGYFGFSNGPSP
jgi:hypothetical protein